MPAPVQLTRVTLPTGKTVRLRLDTLDAGAVGHYRRLLESVSPLQFVPGEVPLSDAGIPIKGWRLSGFRTEGRGSFRLSISLPINCTAVCEVVWDPNETEHVWRMAKWAAFRAFGQPGPADPPPVPWMTVMPTLGFQTTGGAGAARQVAHAALLLAAGMILPG